MNLRIQLKKWFGARVSPAPAASSTSAPVQSSQSIPSNNQANHSTPSQPKKRLQPAKLAFGPSSNTNVGISSEGKAPLSTQAIARLSGTFVDYSLPETSSLNIIQSPHPRSGILYAREMFSPPLSPLPEERTPTPPSHLNITHPADDASSADSKSDEKAPPESSSEDTSLNAVRRKAGQRKNSVYSAFSDTSSASEYTPPQEGKEIKAINDPAHKQPTRRQSFSPTHIRNSLEKQERKRLKDAEINRLTAAEHAHRNDLAREVIERHQKELASNEESNNQLREIENTVIRYYQDLMQGLANDHQHCQNHRETLLDLLVNRPENSELMDHCYTLQRGRIAPIELKSKTLPLSPEDLAIKNIATYIQTIKDTRDDNDQKKYSTRQQIEDYRNKEAREVRLARINPFVSASPQEILLDEEPISSPRIRFNA